MFLRHYKGMDEEPQLLENLFYPVSTALLQNLLGDKLSCFQATATRQFTSMYSQLQDFTYWIHFRVQIHRKCINRGLTAYYENPMSIAVYRICNSPKQCHKLRFFAFPPYFLGLTPHFPKVYVDLVLLGIKMLFLLKFFVIRRYFYL